MEAKASIYGVPDFSTLTENQAVFLEAFRGNPPGVLIEFQMRGPKWTTFLRQQGVSPSTMQGVIGRTSR